MFKILTGLAYVAVGLSLSLGSVGDVSAKDDKNADKMTAYIEEGQTKNEAVVTLWMTNSDPIAGITLPLKFAPGAGAIKLDSLLTKNGLAAGFHATPPQYVEKNQTLLMNLLVLVDSTTTLADAIPPGQGMLAQLFFSAKGKFPFASFEIAAVQLPPENRLLFVTTIAESKLPEFVFTRKPAPAWPVESKKDTGEGK
jgi:hypothetical protein